MNKCTWSFYILHVFLEVDLVVYVWLCRADIPGICNPKWNPHCLAFLVELVSCHLMRNLYCIPLRLVSNKFFTVFFSRKTDFEDWCKHTFISVKLMCCKWCTWCKNLLVLRQTWEGMYMFFAIPCHLLSVLTAVECRCLLGKIVVCYS